MIYQCGCGFTTISWDGRKTHLKTCGKAVDGEVPQIGKEPLPEQKFEPNSLEKFLVKK